MRSKNLNRRKFLQHAVAALPVGAVLLQHEVRAQDLPKLEESDPAAAALLYVHDNSEVDTSNPIAARFEPSQKCLNCAQIQGEEGPEWRPCGIFPGKLVSINGWCSVWAAKP